MRNNQEEKTLAFSSVRIETTEDHPRRFADIELGSF